MTTISDVSPTSSNTKISGQFPSGRMLCLASSQDGRIVFAGSLSSNLWVSQDFGRTWSQITWPQPPADQFGVPGAIGGFCVTDVAVAPDAGRWFVDRAPRVMADLTGSGRADIVGFGETGVWTALSDGSGGFGSPRIVLANFGYQAGGWRVDKHPRFLADLTGDGRADIVGFGDAGVWTALGNGDGTFQDAHFVIADLGYEAGGWRVDKHPRFLADLTGNGRADIVGFGDAGVYVALSNGDGTFTYQPVPVIDDFGYVAGGWRVDKHPRLLADLTGDGRADIVGFGDAGVYVALSNGDGTFAYQPVPVIDDLGYVAGGWRVDKHPRLLADLTGDGRADIVGFGDAGVYVALSNGDGTFAYQPVPVIDDLGYVAGGWRVDKHPRLLADLTGNGRADIVGFGDAGVYVALSNGDGTFAYQPVPVIDDLGYVAGGWRVDKHPRLLADLTGNGRADIVGFGDAGVYVALSNGEGTFQTPQFVLPNFGFELTVLAVARSDREAADSGIWRSTDGGSTWSRVHQFPLGGGNPPPAGQMIWAPGTGNLLYAAGATSLAISQDAGTTFQDVMPIGSGFFQAVNHVAVAQTPSGSLIPPVVYALADSTINVSFDGGVTWTMDQGSIPKRLGGAVGLANAQAASVMVVSPRSPLEVFALTNANPNPKNGETHQLFRGDYTQFFAANQSDWETMPLPTLGQQFSGNVFVAATQPGHGDVLFYCPQQSKTFAGPLDPASASDWVQLDQSNVVHQDLHGIYLSPDFQATFVDGQYQRIAGTIWVTSDGGIDRSDDGGLHFTAGDNVETLSCVNIAGVAAPGQGPNISLNTGDNDGFFSINGAQNWWSQEYGGGDDDCSFSDPLRPQSMLIFTPRWNTSAQGTAARTGQTVTVYETAVGQLPDARRDASKLQAVARPDESGLRFLPALPGATPMPATTVRHVVPGPPLLIDNDPRSNTIFGNIWNANSGFGSRGSRPIVLNMPGDDPSAPGDYVFIRFNAFTPTVLVRTQNLLEITDRIEWETPGEWRVDKHPRLLADLTGNGRADIIGFGDAGVWTALSNGDGTFQEPRLVIADFGYEAGGWRVDKHPRFLADLTGDGRADIVGFGDAGVWTALGNGDGTFQDAHFVIADLGYEAGGWRVDKHPRFLADLTGDGRADIVGFGDAGVYVALSNGDGTFTYQPVPVIDDFGYEAGGWRVDKHPRLLADLTGDGRADIVGFGDAGVYVALSNGDGTFAYQPVPVIDDLGYVAGGWRVDKHPRLLADLTGDGRADIVGFGDAGVYVALSNGDGTFAYQPVPVIDDLGYVAGGWRVDKHPRLLADLTGNGRADIVGFGDAGVYVALSNGDGTFAYQPVPVIDDFGYVAGDWRVDKHPRFLADVRGHGLSDIVGFGDAGVLLALSNGDGTFATPAMFVVANFGYGGEGLVSQQGPALPAYDAGVAQASGGHTETVFYVGGNSANNLWKWTEGMANWAQLVPGRGASQARRFFVNPYDPSLIYLLDIANVRRSDDGGDTWQTDPSLEQMLSCGGRIPISRDETVSGQGDFADVVLTDMKFDPLNPGRRFAIGEAGAFFTDDGATWVRLLDAGALRGRPLSCYYDWISDPSGPALYVAFAGRSLVKITDFLPIILE